VLLIAAGFLVGAGTALGNGCTSGHGICGCHDSRRARPPPVATFMAAAMVTVFVASSRSLREAVIMREIAAALLTGFHFRFGALPFQHDHPAVVQGFLDIAGAWNPTLAFVMAGGVAVTFVGYRMILPRGRPLWAPRFSLPAATAIDAPLPSRALQSSVLDGVLAGYCPGPAVVRWLSGRTAVLIFVLAMLTGMIFVTMDAHPSLGYDAATPVQERSA